MTTSQPFTALELAYLASGARALAHLASEDAKRSGNPSIRSVFEQSERTYRELAAKCERLAQEPEANGALELPVFRQPR